MGNCCGKSISEESPFSKPGHTLGAAPADDAVAPRTQQVPPSAKRASVPNAVNRTLGGSGSTSNDPRSAAARAAEERAAKANAPKGKLGEALAQERKQTRTDTLEAASKQERLAREADQNTKALQHD